MIENEVIYDSFYDFSSDGTCRDYHGSRIQFSRAKQTQQITGEP